MTRLRIKLQTGRGEVIKVKELAKYADYLFVLSFLPLMLAAYGAFTESDLWLAPTQWGLITIGMVVYALYMKLKTTAK